MEKTSTTFPFPLIPEGGKSGCGQMVWIKTLRMNPWSIVPGGNGRDYNAYLWF
jgi:hypothetical protein